VARAPRIVVLDRDGVINEDSGEFIKSVAEWQPIPGSLEAIAELTAAGFLVAVVTNQSGVARGLFTEETLLAIHQPSSARAAGSQASTTARIIPTTAASAASRAPACCDAWSATSGCHCRALRS
jgi:histidinol-phosphate phosphatase family protein